MFVAVEGIEGSGKSTLAGDLAAGLRADGYAVSLTREPGGTPAGDAMRALFLDRAFALEPLAESLLVNAARAQHVAEVIRPALAAGRIVVSDRFTDSTLAYQGYGRGLDLETLRVVSSIAAGGLEPDLVLLLDVPLAVARARLRQRSPEIDRIEAEDDAFHQRVARGFLELAAGSPRHRVLDAMQPPPRVLAQALDALREATGTGVP
jgi:dTMP kinase